MDACFTDITIEFLSVAFNSILHYTTVYPKSVFETRKKYGVVVYRCIHPEVNQYIELCLKSVAECLKNGHLSRVEFSVTDAGYAPVVKFVFDFVKDDHFDDISDAYLVQAEQNLRAFCLNLSTVSSNFQELPEDCSFTIHLHTNEVSAVSMATNPDLEEFPLVEVEESLGMDKILPLRRFSVRNYSMDTYVEFKQ